MSGVRKSRSDLETESRILLGLIRQRDQAALAMFYDIRAGWVYSLVLSIVRNASDAEEVTLDVFLRVWEAADSYDESRGSVSAWLTTITRRLAIDKTRSKQFRSSSRETNIENSDPIIDPQHPEQQLVESDERKHVNEALSRLNEPLKEVIQMSYYYGWSHSMIARKLSIPLGTAKSRIHEAVAQLRKMFEGTR
jgi:RNA polymerase sigma-70 factor (ECF subfamily)